MKILFLVHVEEMFRQWFPPMFVQRCCKAMNDYDRVICLVSEVMDDHPIGEIHHRYWYTQWLWGWGYEAEQFDEDEDKWIIEAQGHEYTWVPPELRDADQWNQHEISVGGGGRHECLEDFINVLDFMEIKHRLVKGLIY